MIATATVRFYAELTDHLVGGRAEVECRFTAPATVEDLIASWGVPFDEVDLVLKGGVSVGPDTEVSDGDRLAVFPVFESFDVAALTRVRPTPLRRTRLVVDSRLGELSGVLAQKGVDVDSRPPRQAVRVSIRDRRILITGDRGLLGNPRLTHALMVTGNDPGAQAQEVLTRLQLTDPAP